MDDLVLYVQNEVALDGESGKQTQCADNGHCNSSSWSRFWFLVDHYLHTSRNSTSATSTESSRESLTDTDPSQITRTDEKFRLFFWNNFVREDGVLLFVRNSGTNDTPNGIPDDTRASFVPFSELEVLDQPEITYTEVMENYKDRIRIVATAEQQRITVLGYSGTASQISNQALQVLQSVTAAREFGATQAQLAKLHKIDPRSMFHFLKVLIEMKLIVKIPVTTDGQYTLLCLHTKFASLNPGYKAMTSDDNFSSAGRPLVTGDGGRRFEGLLKSDNKKVSYYSGLIKQKLTDILGRAKNNAMSIEDLAKALDLMDMNVVQNRWFNRQIELLCKLKYIKRVHVPGVYRCIQLLRPYGINISLDEGEVGQLNLKSVIADDTPQSGICIDSSIEHQVYKHILDSREKGTIAKEIRRKMNMLNVKLLARILDTLSKPASANEKPLVHRVVEFVGRERRYRYYSKQGFESGIAEDHKEYIEKSKAFPVLVLPPRTGRNQKKNKASTSSNTQAASTTTEPPAGAFEPSLAPINTNAETEGTPLSDTANGAIPDAVVSQESEEVADNLSSPTNGSAPSITAVRIMPESTQPGAPERFISVGLLKRRKIILSILERKKMIELHQSLVTEYQLEKARLYPDQEENSVIDRKTLYRTINILESEGFLKIYKVENLPLAGEGTVTKTFCLHPLVDPESEEVKNFMRECTNRHLLFGSLGMKPARKHEKVELEVESLDEMQRRLGQDFYKSPLVPLSDVGAIAPKPREYQKTRHRGPEFEGLDTATEYGWNRAKMMRALVFHRFLLDKLGSNDKALFNYPSNPNVLSTTPLFEVLHLRVFLFVVGIIQPPSEECREYLLLHRDSSIPLVDLPEHMRPYAAPNHNFKKRLREVLEILDALGLVSPLAGAPSYAGTKPLEYATNHLVLNTHYEIHVNVKAPLDPRVPDQLDHDLESRKEYMLLAIKECREFWMDLQASASVMKYVATHRSVARPWSEIRRDFLLNLCNKRIWAEPIRVSSAQTEKLMTQVNTKIRFAPPAHDPRVDEMARETGLPRDHVVQFYKAIMKVWHTHPMPQKTTRLPQVKRARRAVIDKQELSIAPITRAPTTSGATTSTTSQHQGLIDSQGPSITSIQERGGRFSVGQPKKSRSRRIVWDDSEDEKLLLAYAVTRCISDTFNYKFSWTCIARVFEGSRSREVCRHRYSKLIREAGLAKRVESFRAQFSHVLPTIPERFGIYRKLDDFDLNPLLEYFKPSTEASMSVATFSSPLPIDPYELEQYNQVRQSERFSCMYAGDRLHAELSLPRRLRLINQLPPTLRTSCSQELDHMLEDLCSPRVVSTDIPEDLVGQGEKKYTSFVVHNEILSIEHTILAVVKAIYSLPRQKRPRSVIRAILSSFQSSKVLDTCELAKEWKILTGIKNAYYRIPGQRVGRSERFSILMNGAYPRRLTAAATEIDEIYNKASDRLFQLDAGPAEMMVFLTDLAMGWLELSMAKSVGGVSAPTAFVEPYGQGAILHFDVLMKNTRSLTHPTAMSTPTRIQSFESLQDDRNGDEDGIRKSGSSSSAAEILDEKFDAWQNARDRAHADFMKLLGSGVTEDQKPLYKNVYIDVLGSSTSGMILQDIKNSLQEKNLFYQDKDIVECIRKLQIGRPPILIKVGMAQARFVVFGWHQTWTVNYHDAHVSAELDPLHWVVPRMWKTLSGEGALLKYFYKMFLAVELDEMIEELEKRKAIEARYGILPQQVGLFSKRSEYVRCDRDTIDERKVTNYFAQPAYYMYLDMRLVVSDNSGRDMGLQGGEGGEGDGEDKDGGDIEDTEEGGNEEGGNEEGGNEEGETDQWLSEEPQAKKARVDE
ncbi:hypothetical protein BGX27_004713 [Mortierella sp. AM989]|nr:hypothetical protein BGX27_004713 [Mortierella sp. AM989]